MVLTIKNFESQNVGPGVTETAPTNLVGVAGTLKATLTWTSATGESGVTWTEEKLVRKEGSAPSGSMDGTTVATITTKDTYATTGYEDTGLDSTKTYYYKVFAVYDNGTERGSSDVNVTPLDGQLLFELADMDNSSEIGNLSTNTSLHPLCSVSTTGGVVTFTHSSATRYWGCRSIKSFAFPTADKKVVVEFEGKINGVLLNGEGRYMGLQYNFGRNITEFGFGQRSISSSNAYFSFTGTTLNLESKVNRNEFCKFKFEIQNNLANAYINDELVVSNVDASILQGKTINVNVMGGTTSGVKPQEYKNLTIKVY